MIETGEDIENTLVTPVESELENYTKIAGQNATPAR
jgi:hypothetical protein